MPKKRQTVADKRSTRVLAKAAELAKLSADASDLKADLERDLAEVVDKYQERIAELNQTAADIAQFDLIGEVEETLSNLEEKFWKTERYQNLEAFKDALESALGDIEGTEIGDMSDYEFSKVLESLDELVNNADNAASTLEGVDIP